MCQRRLLDRHEWPDLAAIQADRSQEYGRRDQPRVRGERQYGSRQDHQRSTELQHPCPSETVRGSNGLQRDEVHSLTEAFSAIPDAETRASVLALVRSLTADARVRGVPSK